MILETVILIFFPEIALWLGSSEALTSRTGRRFS